MHKVFVYGTLKKGEPNHDWLTRSENGVSKFVCKAETTRKLPLVIATKYNIPFLLDKPGVGHFVKGEIYEVDDRMLSNLDVLEDHPNFYVREIDQLKPIGPDLSEELQPCWVYLLKKFKPCTLNRPHLVDYSSKAEHGLEYCERFKRDKTYDAKTDL